MIGDKKVSTVLKRYKELRNEKFPVEDAVIYRLVAYSGLGWDEVREIMREFYRKLVIDN